MNDEAHRSADASVKSPGSLAGGGRNAGPNRPGAQARLEPAHGFDDKNRADILRRWRYQYT